MGRAFIRVLEIGERRHQVSGVTVTCAAGLYAHPAVREPGLGWRVAESLREQLGGVIVVRQNVLVDLGGARQQSRSLDGIRLALRELDEAITHRARMPQSCELCLEPLACTGVTGIDGQGRAQRSERLIHRSEPGPLQLRAREPQVHPRLRIGGVLDLRFQGRVDLGPAGGGLVQPHFHVASRPLGGTSRQHVAHESERTLRVDRGQRVGRTHAQRIRGGRVGGLGGLVEQGSGQPAAVAGACSDPGEPEHRDPSTGFDAQDGLVGGRGAQGVAHRLFLQQRDRLEVRDPSLRVPCVLCRMRVHGDTGAHFSERGSGRRRCQHAEQEIHRFIVGGMGDQSRPQVLHGASRIAQRLREPCRANQ